MGKVKSQKVKWETMTREGDRLEFVSLFKKGKGKDRTLEIKHKQEIFTINYGELLAYCYSVAKEDERLRLADLRAEEVVDLNYDVEFKLTPNEIKKGRCGRRIQLPISKVKLSLYENQMIKLAKKDFKSGNKNEKINKKISKRN